MEKPTHHFVSRPRLQLSALANEPFVLPPRAAVPMFHEAVLRACREAGFVPHAPYEVDHLQMVLRMVAAGAGVALVPASARKVNQDRVIYRALRPRPILCKRPLRGVEKTRLRRWPNSSAWRDDRCITCASRSGEFPSPARPSGTLCRSATDTPPPPRKIERFDRDSGRSHRGNPTTGGRICEEVIGESDVPDVSVFIIANLKNSLFLLNGSRKIGACHSLPM